MNETELKKWLKDKREAIVGRYTVRSGKVVEWEFDNAADERPDGIYTLFAGPHPDHLGLRATPATKPAAEGTPAEPLRALKEQILDIPCPSGEPPSCATILELIDAAIATKPAETPDTVPKKEAIRMFNALLQAETLPPESIELLKSLFPAHPTESAGKRPEAVSAYRVWAKGGRFTRGLYEAKNMTETEFKIFAAAGDTLEPLYTAETQRSSNATRSDDESAWIASLQPGERGAVQPTARAWLIEMTAGPTPAWFSGVGFTNDSTQAIRFPSKKAAETIFAALREARPRLATLNLDWDCYAITEHEWATGIQPPAPEPDAFLFHYRKIGGGRRYTIASLPEQTDWGHPDPEAGFEYVSKEPLYATSSIAQRGADDDDKIWQEGYEAGRSDAETSFRARTKKPEK